MISLHVLFQDHAVLQQRQWNPVWGNAVPGHRLQIQFAGAEFLAKVNASGAFKFRLPPLPASGPYSMVITDVENQETVTINDLMIGEVWVASGQSNMEYQLISDWTSTLAQKADPSSKVNKEQKEEYCDTITDPAAIRFFTVQKEASGMEEDTCSGEWKYMSPETAPWASAVAAWFARYVQKNQKVAVGLIITAWGGTIAESWTSRAGLLSNPETAPMVPDMDNVFFETDWPVYSVTPTSYEAYFDPGNKGFDMGWADPAFDDSAWKSMAVPGSWIMQKISGNGALWVRQEINIPASWRKKDLILNLGGIDKHDTTYFNGVKVGGMGKEGETTFWDTPRHYRIPAELVKEGKNVVAVRAYSFMHDGALGGGKEDYFIQPEGEDDKIFFAGIWKAEPEYDLGVLCPAAMPGPGYANTPGILFNSMLRPLIPYGIRGAIWYQGESNANTLPGALAYEEKLCTMIRDWRYHWGQGDFPFIQVQLANYSPLGAPAYDAASRWAVLRDAQRKVCEKLPGVTMCTAIDVGNLLDIHPHDKKSVGKRMADNALYHVYGQKSIVPFGPLYRRSEVEGDGIRIYFDYADGMTIKEDLPQSFYVAGPQRGFYPATSVEICGDSILVRCKDVKTPYSVRYGWSDALINTLYNSAGLPASPFRTDHWDFY